MKVRYSYLPQQFEDCEDLWQDLKDFVATGDFTLGEPLTKFEKSFAKLIGTKYAVGVNSGTDAIKLSLKALNIGPGDEVITAANTFVATVGPICELGATPVFVDCNDTFCMDTDLVEAKITEKTKAFLPVHYTGYMTDMRVMNQLSEKYNIPVVEDACQSILGAIDGRNAGTWGKTGAFSLHPLKNINVWSDGGVIVTDDDGLYKKLRLLRNHGFENRDTVVMMGYNSRLDTIQAVVGNWILPQAKSISDKRISNAKYLDNGLQEINEISIPPRPEDFRLVFHLYIVFAKDRDGLLKHCLDSGIDAKIHYPIPIYKQAALGYLGYKDGDFPVTDEHVEKIITFPCDQHLEQEQLDFIISTVAEYYAK
jgi:dTDP-3-amino-2,3,6-trideoxy-4-keto-D-glucose/dTDP-3-amino-3,4,6-trideoxy-alpha-D-glucose/dTDP-2,6-dideoxy-D-kanosamine transaminase